MAGGPSRPANSAIVRPAGLRILVPGYPQWMWRQRERALVMFGSHVTALGVGLFAWGTSAGLLVLGFAFLTHVVSATDAIRQGAFPGFGRWVPVLSASAGLGFGCYAPFLITLSVLAWPGDRTAAPEERYLINRWAYHNAEPDTDHWVWYERSKSDGRGIGRMLAGPGQIVEWDGKRLWVGGVEVAWRPPDPARGGFRDLSLIVPEDQVLLAPIGPDPAGSDSFGLVPVPSRAILGRAWARHHPIWNPRLLP